MKNFIIIIALLVTAFFPYGAMAQAQSPWILQHTNGLAATPNPSVIFSAVDENVCWGINTNSSQYLRTIDGGTNWTTSLITNELLIGSSISAIDASTAWAVLRNTAQNTGGIFKTTDGGVSWNKHTSAFSGTGGQPKIILFFDAINCISVGDPRGNPFNWEIYTTTDGGEVWNQVNSANIPTPLAFEKAIPKVGVSAGNSFWFNTFHGSLYKTTDYGLTWIVVRDVMGDQDGFGFAFKDNLNGLAVTFVSSNKISKTTDGGLTWERITLEPPGLSGVSPFYISYAKGTDSTYVITSHNNIGGAAAANPGSAYTTNNGKHWAHLDFLPRGPMTFAAERFGWSGGLNDSIYKWDTDMIPTYVNENNNIVESFILEQNYPNPFNPSTTIQFQIPNSSFVSLKIYDILGNKLATLVNQEKLAGTYEVEFDAADLTSGVYVYSIQAGSFFEIKKMVLVK